MGERAELEKLSQPSTIHLNQYHHNSCGWCRKIFNTDLLFWHSKKADMPPTTSPHSAGAGVQQKAPLMRRQSSQSSQTSKHTGVASPGSGGEYQPLRHTIKPARRTKIVLPRNHSSARDLAKLSKQAQAHQQQQQRHSGGGEDAKTVGSGGARHRSHEGDTEIRLPGSLDESAQPMRRNLTAYQLPRNTSYTKLKKNLSHGQLNRITSGKNLAGMNAAVPKGPPSPGFKGKNKKSKSADMGVVVRDMQAQHEEHAREQEDVKAKEGAKKVGFAVGSSGDSENEAPDMEGSGLQEDEWTDQSASASPYSTRQNSRRASMTQDKPPDKRTAQECANGKAGEAHQHAQSPLTTEVKAAQDNGERQDEEEDSSDEPPSPKSLPNVYVTKREEARSDGASEQTSEPKAQIRSPLHAAKEPANPATKFLLSRGASSTAQAQVSLTKTIEEMNNAYVSPAPSMHSSRSNLDHDQEELVSRFIPTASHPTTGSVSGTSADTPKTGSYQTPERDSMLASQNREGKRAATFHLPQSPGSTISGSSGHVTPAMVRSRTELRMMNEKAVAELEDAASRNPIIPPHVYDRRNESLKTYLQSTNLQRSGSSVSLNPHLSLGPELFQGRFKAVNTELKVVQRFRDPIGESVRRLQLCKGSNFTQLRGQRVSPQKQAAAKVPISKSAVSLARGPSKLSTSISPPRSASPVKAVGSGAKSATHSATQLRTGDGRRGKVAFSLAPSEVHEADCAAQDGDQAIAKADAIARQLWEGPMA